MEAVDELCRLALSAGRLGCRVVLVDVDPELRDLLELAGVDEVLLDDFHETRTYDDSVTTSAPAPSVEQFEAHRRELTGFCYRMLGSGSEAEDAVQETLAKAWRSADRFEGRSSVRTWLFRIASNVCVDMSRSPQRRARPVDLGPVRTPDPVHLSDVLPEDRWITPVADEHVLDLDGDPGRWRPPATRSVSRSSPRSSGFPPASVPRSSCARCWPGRCATSPNCSRRRRRRSTARCNGPEPRWPRPGRGDVRALDTGAGRTARPVPRCVRALRHGRPRRAAPRGRHPDHAALRHVAPGPGRSAHLVHRARHRLQGIAPAGGLGQRCPAFAQYRVDPDGGHAPWALQVLELDGDRIAAVHSFLDTDECFERFGFPAHLPAP